MEIYAQKLQKTEKSGNLQLILAIANSKITFPCGKSPWKKKVAPFWNDFFVAKATK